MTGSLLDRERKLAAVDVGKLPMTQFKRVRREKSSLYRLLLCFAFASLLLPAQVSYSIGSGAAVPDSTLLFNISITGGTKPAALQWTLDYYLANVPGITVTTGPAATAAGKSVSCSNLPGSVTCIVAGPNNTGIADGVVAQAIVQIAASATHASTPLQLRGTVSSVGSGSGVPSNGSDGELMIADMPPAQRFIPMTPCRVMDTRNPAGPLGGPAIAGGTTRSFALPSSTNCSIPANAAAYSLNVATVPRDFLDYLTVWPSGQPQPLVATLTSPDGRTRSTGAVIPAGASGAISVYATNTTDVVLDINGYFVPATTPSALAYYPLAPCRVADTRNADGPLGGPYLAAESVRNFPMLDATSCNIPSTARAYAVNLAVVPRGGPMGYLTAWPSGQSQPVVATLNDPTGTILSNAAIVPAGNGGQIDVYVTNDTDLVIDVDGYFAPPDTAGLSLYTLTPCRALDTRLPAGSPPFNKTLNASVVDNGCGVPGSARAYIFNATLVPVEPVGYLTLWPQGLTQPLVANVNDSDGTITGNMAVVPTSNGFVSAFVTNPTYLVLDLFAYFAP